MNEPIVSVVLPAYNVSPYLPEAIAMLRNQTLRSIEIIVVDDGSTDDSAGVALAAFGDDSRCRLLRLQRNKGVAAAREAGVGIATAPWVWFVDADDRWEFNSAKLLADSADEDIDVVIGGARYVYKTGAPPRELFPPKQDRMIGDQAFEKLLVGEVTGHLWNKIFRRTLLQEIHFPVSRVHSDLALVAEALGRARSVRCIRATVYDYLVREGSIITSGSKRTESLRVVKDVAERCYLALSEERRSELRSRFEYFVHRYILLSGLKDTANLAYTAEEREHLRSRIVRQMSWEGACALAREGDFRRSMSVIGIKLCPPLSGIVAKKMAT